jgi:hypothetical protein
LFGSLVVSTQMPLHDVRPDGHIVPSVATTSSPSVAFTTSAIGESDIVVVSFAASAPWLASRASLVDASLRFAGGEHAETIAAIAKRSEADRAGGRRIDMARRIARLSLGGM